MSERTGRRLSRREAWLALAAIIAGAGLLAILPTERVMQLRELQRAALQPAQVAGEKVAGIVGSWRSSPSPDAPDLAEQCEQLEQRLVEIEAAAQRAVARAAPTTDDGASLLETSLLPTRIVGQQGRTFLEHLATVDAGEAQQVLPEAWVLDTSLPLVEAGRTSQIESDDLVLAGGQVWGQVQAVGPRASTIRRATSAGYHAEVELMKPGGDLHAAAPSGVLEGTGEPLCRIRMVPVTEAVSVGDLVLTAASDELLPTPLVYGRIVRCERSTGALYWDLWMEPAAAPEPERVAIVRMTLKSPRFAQSETDKERR